MTLFQNDVIVAVNGVIVDCYGYIFLRDTVVFLSWDSVIIVIFFSWFITNMFFGFESYF